LRPGAVPQIARIPAHELTNRSIPVTAVTSASGARLIRCAHADRRVSVQRLGQLIADIRRHGGVDARADCIARLGRADVVSISMLSQAFGMSQRALRAWSLATLGMGLKRLLKIRRLHAALEMRLSGSCGTWSRTAAAAGYADQPHLVRDCRALLGEPPAAFVGRGL
jgi:AraC-like DNA-binding protein